MVFYNKFAEMIIHEMLLTHWAHRRNLTGKYQM